jgi:energy-coupling factor transport system substrate-specific component
MKLQAKDLITVGIFTAIMFVICMGVAMIGYIPIFIPLLTVIVPVVGGIPFMLFLTKVKKFGMVWIMSLLIGIIMGFGGMGYLAIATTAVFGFLAELILKSGEYRRVSKGILCYGVFSMWIIGNYLPMFIGRESYVAMLIEGYGQEYADTLMGYISAPWVLLPLLAACFVSGIAGGLLGRSVLKKHFLRAGIA